MKRISYLAAISASLLLTACQTQTSKPEAAKPAAATPPATAAAPAAMAAPAAAPAAAATMSAPGEIIIDNRDPGFKSEGGWTSASGGHDYKDETVWATATGPTETPATATWTPEIKAAGQFDVYEWHGDDPNTDHANNAPFTVNYDGGSKTIPVDLRANTGRWNLLGTFKFAAGKTGNVTLSSKASGNVIADAVRFVPHS
jgi:hypothetical protein